MSSNVDDRTIHELYVFPFMDSLKAGTASVMCSYQRANNSYGCQNSKLLNGILKTELGFVSLEYNGNVHVTSNDIHSKALLRRIGLLSMLALPAPMLDWIS
jgi:beta-glucosidase-like glycosyl hydrolase